MMLAPRKQTRKSRRGRRLRRCRKMGKGPPREPKYLRFARLDGESEGFRTEPAMFPCSRATGFVYNAGRTPGKWEISTNTEILRHAVVGADAY